MLVGAVLLGAAIADYANIDVFGRPSLREISQQETLQVGLPGIVTRARTNIYFSGLTDSFVRTNLAGSIIKGHPARGFGYISNFNTSIYGSE